MAFAVIIGGIGTIEGPILGTIVYMVLQQTLQSYNAWYLIVLGIVAIVIALFARRGLWGTVDEHFNIPALPRRVPPVASGPDAASPASSGEPTQPRNSLPVMACAAGFCPGRTGRSRGSLACARLLLPPAPTPWSGLT